MVLLAYAEVPIIRNDLIWPSHQTVMVGKPAVIYCTSKHPSWFHNKSPMQPFLVQNLLFINSVKESDGGKYFCKGKDRNNKHFIATSVLKVSGEKYYMCKHWAIIISPIQNSTNQTWGKHLVMCLKQALRQDKCLSTSTSISTFIDVMLEALLHALQKCLKYKIIYKTQSH